ncbi:hypothetical protein HAX54_041966 [Datura stramonium]|uniref:Uncharacterized protein n=1 Tax=Datura stramonium TaxID=4076 RepID=A0ABS8W084_DATST|nr:hypothetical protein [Datura stramonium]
MVMVTPSPARDTVHHLYKIPHVKRLENRYVIVYVTGRHRLDGLSAFRLLLYRRARNAGSNLDWTSDGPVMNDDRQLPTARRSDGRYFLHSSSSLNFGSFSMGIHWDPRGELHIWFASREVQMNFLKPKSGLLRFSGSSAISLCVLVPTPAKHGSASARGLRLGPHSHRFFPPGCDMLQGNSMQYAYEYLQ